MKFRLEVQTWCSDLSSGLGIFNPRLKIEDWRLSRTLPRESSIPDWRLKIEDFPGLSLENLQSRIEDWRLKIFQDSPWRIFNPGLKIFQDSPWTISLEESSINPGLKIEDWRFSRTLPGESSIPDEDFPGLSLENLNPGLKIEDFLIKDSPTRVLRNLQSSIFNPGLKILQQESWGIFNLQSSIQD